jgi:hypothetical protein
MAGARLNQVAGRMRLAGRTPLQALLQMSIETFNDQAFPARCAFIEQINERFH